MKMKTSPAIAVALALVAHRCSPSRRRPSQDEYAVYDLLAPETASFRTVYEVAVTTPGATVFHDRHRQRSDDRCRQADDGVVDLMTGAPLKYTVTQRARSRCSWRVRFRPTAARRVCGSPRPTRTRRTIAAMATGSSSIAPFRIRHAAIILPAGYQLTECNVPSQVLADPDGRIRVSFMHQAPGAAALVLKAKPGAPTGDAAKPRPLTNARTLGNAADAGTDRARAAVRARASGSRHRLLPAAAGDQRVQPVSRLHRVARRHRQVPQRRADRQHGVEHVGEDARHRRSPEGRDAHRRADEGGRASMPAAIRSRRISRSSSRASRRSRRGSRFGCGSRKPIPRRRAIASRATSSCSSAASAGRATRSCCRAAGISPRSRFPRSSGRRPTA